MKKKIVSVISAAAMFATLVPAAFADYYSDFEGYYYTGNTDGTGGASMQIVSCTSSSITLRFGRVKNDVESYSYTFDEGVVTGQTAVIPFHAVQVNGAEFDGTMNLTFSGAMVKISNVSSLGTEIYRGTLPKSDIGMLYFNNTASDDTPAAAATPVPTVPAEPVYASLTLNGEHINFDANAKPIIMNDYTYVPLRSVFSAMGINVFWDEYQKNSILKEQLITCTKNNTIIQFARTFNATGYNKWTLKKWEGEGTTTADVPVQNIDISEMQPEIISDRAYVPLRVISEAFGSDVSWDDSNKQVIITCDTGNVYWYNKDQIGRIEDFSITEARTAITQDYSSVVPDTETPYFRADTKFYSFSGEDQWNRVKLCIAYNVNMGAYIDSVMPIEAEINTDNTPAAIEASVVDEETADTAADEKPAEETVNDDEVSDETKSIEGESDPETKEEISEE